MHKAYKHQANARIIHNLNKPIKERLASRKFVGPYIVTPTNANKDTTRHFYLDSDFMPVSRWKWCDELTDINHKGWYCDQFNDQLIRGVVFFLPGNKGFLAGWSMGESMISGLDTYSYATKENAALAADSWAESVAEDMRLMEAMNDE